MPRKRVLIISYEEFPSFIGLSSRVKGLGLALKETGWSISIAAPCYSSDQLRIKECDGIPIYQMRMPDVLKSVKIPIVRRVFFLVLFTCVTVNKFLREDLKFDFFQSEQLYPYLGCLILARLKKGKLILDDVTMLGILAEHRLKTISGFGSLLKWMVERFEMLCYKKADYIFCSSKKTEEYLENKSGSYELPLFLVPNGVDINQYSYKLPKVDGTGFYFNCSLPFYQNVAALDNVLDIVDYFALKNKSMQFHGTIIVNNKNLLQTNTRNRILSNRSVRLESKVESVVPFLHDAAMVLLPYKTGHFLTAGSRLKALEALSCGSVIFSTPEGIDGVEGCVDGLNVILCSDVEDMVKKLTSFLLSPDRTNFAEKISCNARKLVEERYSWKNIVKSYSLISN